MRNCGFDGVPRRRSAPARFFVTTTGCSNAVFLHLSCRGALLRAWTAERGRVIRAYDDRKTRRRGGSVPHRKGRCMDLATTLKARSHERAQERGRPMKKAAQGAQAMRTGGRSAPLTVRPLFLVAVAQLVELLFVAGSSPASHTAAHKPARLCSVAAAGERNRHK